MEASSRHGGGHHLEETQDRKQGGQNQQQVHVLQALGVRRSGRRTWSFSLDDFKHAFNRGLRGKRHNVPALKQTLKLLSNGLNRQGGEESRPSER
ncbi:hypothetical protein EYF80_039172 [Liparis tanakae]|uniref:Uncharacterized protein n=1 Tax=Liparis tanakae TaxID=230148 RepID=A0A4Z2GAN6_9TELE|nr:hypothetical protein EYF80_039172 [Liparis tanakae]